MRFQGLNPDQFVQGNHFTHCVLSLDHKWLLFLICASPCLEPMKNFLLPVVYIEHIFLKDLNEALTERMVHPTMSPIILQVQILLFMFCSCVI